MVVASALSPYEVPPPHPPPTTVVSSVVAPVTGSIRLMCPLLGSNVYRKPSGPMVRWEAVGPKVLTAPVLTVSRRMVPLWSKNTSWPSLTMSVGPDTRAADPDAASVFPGDPGTPATIVAT